MVEDKKNTNKENGQKNKTVTNMVDLNLIDQ